MSSVNGISGNRLMPQLLDEIALNHDRLYATVTLAGGKFREVNFSEVSAAINHLAHQIVENIGLSNGKHETIAYLGANDLRYAIVFQAGIKCGYKVLLPSPRNTAATNRLLLGSTQCTKIIHSGEVLPKVQELQANGIDLLTWPIPSLLELLDKKSDPFPFIGTFEERKWEPILVLHSSGSTGAPKPIVMNHATFAVADHDRVLPTIPGRKNQNYSMWDFPEGGKFYSPFPGFHLAGFSAMVPLPIYARMTSVVLGPADRPPAPDVAINIMKSMPIKALFCPPIIAEGLAADPDGLTLAKKLKFLLYAGGPLSETAGSALSQVTDVCQFYGQTETGPIQSLIPERENWAWLEWHPIQEVHMEPYIGDLFEMVMKCNPKLEKVRSLSCNFPTEEIWHTRDLFRRHPTKELWQFAGRSDDIIVLSSGEKYNPVPAEVALSSLPGIKGAMIVGRGRFSPALLLEVALSGEKNTVADLWPQVEASNAKTAEFGRISRSLILIASPDKPFERAAKGTVIRALTEKLYEVEIEELYSKQSVETNDAPVITEPVSENSVQEFVSVVIQHITKGKRIQKEVDIFAAGIDSLQVLELIRLLKHGLSSVYSTESLSWLSASLVYSHSTQVTLSQILWQRLANGQDSEELSSPDGMKELIQRESKLIDQFFSNGAQQTLPQSSSVLLTGCTGTLGLHILYSLVLDVTIPKVYCLVRDNAAREKLPPTLKASNGFGKVIFMKFDLGDSRLGLSSDEYNLLAKETSTIIHAAWTLNFNQNLAYFDKQFVASLKYLYQLLAGKKNSHFLFVSSLSTVSNWGSTHGQKPVPEADVSDPAVTADTGYAQSKYVAESICQYAAKKLDVRTDILRVGQISGPLSRTALQTVWKDTEWLPLMLKTSKNLGQIPYDLPAVDWLPVDVVAGVMKDLIHAKTPPSQDQVFNVVNPSTMPFKTLLPSVQQAFGSGLEEVKLQDWIKKLEQTEDYSAKAESLPAIKILDFFASLLNHTPLQYDFDKLRAASSTFDSVQAIDGESVIRWIEHLQL